MPCGTWTVTDVPEADVSEVMGDFRLDSPTSVTKTQQPDGNWTVVATFPPCPEGQPQTTTTSHGG